MKIYIKRFLATINYIFLFIFHHVRAFDSVFYFSKVIGFVGNKVVINSSELSKASILINGTSNIFISDSASLYNVDITVEGGGNKVIFNKGVRLNNSKIIIKGSNCEVVIGEESVFNGVRMVNVGNHCTIRIGSQCLFADFIEIWASDTHAIFNEKLEKINPEKSIFIGDHVWVGSRAILLKGITIDNGSIIGMGTIVTNDVSSNEISVGVPNKIIKKNIYWSLEY